MKKIMAVISDLFERWCEGNDQQALESYLSKSQNISDLETRMRNWQQRSTSKSNFLSH
jgi:hypothetical protein